MSVLGCVGRQCCSTAEAKPISDVVGTIEQTPSTQTQEMLVDAKREFAYHYKHNLLKIFMTSTVNLA